MANHGDVLAPDEGAIAEISAPGTDDGSTICLDDACAIVDCSTSSPTTPSPKTLQVRLAICHYRKYKETFRLLNLPEKAANRHIAKHGDVLAPAEGAIAQISAPGTDDGSTICLDDACAIVDCWDYYDATFAEMMAYAETKSSGSSLSHTNSPQYKAVEWLAQDKIDNGSSWSGYELLQRYVLRVLYHSTDGDNWSNRARTTWFGAWSVCQWSAVPMNSVDLYCNGNGQQVNRIDLYSDNLQGTIPAELGLLTALTYLRLAGNWLAGTIPSQLGQLTALTYMALSINHLTHTIPTQLGQLTALTELYLDDNQLTGTIPLSLTQLTNLEWLSLDNNNLTGQVPSGFCAAPFPDWRADGSKYLTADCMSEVQCDCCNICVDEWDNRFYWNGEWKQI